MNLNQLLGIAAVVQAAQRTSKVARLTSNGDVLTGHARRISGNTEDIESCLLDVTLSIGVETAWPVAELAEEHLSGEFVVDYDW